MASSSDDPGPSKRARLTEAFPDFNIRSPAQYPEEVRRVGVTADDERDFCRPFPNAKPDRRKTSMWGDYPGYNDVLYCK